MGGVLRSSSFPLYLFCVLDVLLRYTHMDGTDLECMAQKIYTYVHTSIATAQIGRLSSSSAPESPSFQSLLIPVGSYGSPVCKIRQFGY